MDIILTSPVFCVLNLLQKTLSTKQMGERTMKKIFMLLFASILLVACSSTTGSNDSGGKGGNEDVDEVTAWAWDPKFNIAALEIAKEAYKDENPELKYQCY